MYEQTLRDMVTRFDNMFTPGMSETRRITRAAKIEGVMAHLNRHTVRRRGETLHQEGYIEWEQTSRIYELFVVQLNLFERIFFTVDVGESTSVVSKLCSAFLVAMIFVSIAVWMVSTLPTVQRIPDGCVGTKVGECSPRPGEAFGLVEQFCVYVFTTEYIVRLITVHSVRFPLLDEQFLESVLTGTGPWLEMVYTSRSRWMPDRLLNLQSSTESLPDMASARRRSEMAVNGIRHDGAGRNLLDTKLLTTVKHVLGPANIIDLLAILPFWIQVILGGDEDSEGGALMVLRILRLTRIFRVFKLGKYNEAFTLFSCVIRQSVPALLLMLFFIWLGCCLFGTLIWFVEGGEWYPEGHEKLLQLDPPILNRGAYLRSLHPIETSDLEESPFASIIHSFWYVIVTITTTGYGDLAPHTITGKLIGALTILMGIIVLAMPIGVVGANFSSEYYRVLKEKRRRQRLKVQMEQVSQEEKEQDNALKEFGAAVPGDKKVTAVEMQRINTVRRQLIDSMMAVDEAWKQVLPPAMYAQLSRRSRAFLGQFLCLGNLAGRWVNQDVAQPVSKPVVSIKRMEELDALTKFIYASLETLLYVEEAPGQVFGLELVYRCRKPWEQFVDNCWEYLVDMCRIEKVPEPGEYFMMRAALASQAILSQDAIRSAPVSHKGSVRSTRSAVKPAPMKFDAFRTVGADIAAGPAMLEDSDDHHAWREDQEEKYTLDELDPEPQIDLPGSLA